MSSSSRRQYARNRARGIESTLCASWIVCGALCASGCFGGGPDDSGTAVAPDTTGVDVPGLGSSPATAGNGGQVAGVAGGAADPTPPAAGDGTMTADAGAPPDTLPAVGARDAGGTMPEVDAGAPPAPVDAGTPPPPVSGETGFMVGMTEAHNQVRAAVDTEPPLAPLTWSDDLALVAQAWADNLASDCSFFHSEGPYGENLAGFAMSVMAPQSAAVRAVEGWAGELACYSYGRFLVDDVCTSACDDSGGCGHYTQMVWRGTERVGCGRAECEDQGFFWEIWVCNYDPPGNEVGVTPY